MLVADEEIIGEVVVVISKTCIGIRVEHPQELAEDSIAVLEILHHNMPHHSSSFLHLIRLLATVLPSILRRRRKKKMQKTFSARLKNSVLRIRRKPRRKTKNRCLLQADLHQPVHRASRILRSLALLSRRPRRLLQQPRNPRSHRSLMLALHAMSRQVRIALVALIHGTFLLSQLLLDVKTSVPNLYHQHTARSKRR
jgi:hypothetical protein